MYIDFEKLPDSSRIWIYQAQRDLIPLEISKITDFLQTSVHNWESHGKSIKGSFKIFYNRILVIGAVNGFDEVSGCSIDSSTRWLKQIGSEAGIDFFDRSVPYFSADEIKYFPIFQIRKYINENIISADTYLLNHQVDTMGGLTKHWKVKASDSPFARYFVSEPA